MQLECTLSLNSLYIKDRIDSIRDRTMVWEPFINDSLPYFIK